MTKIKNSDNPKAGKETSSKQRNQVIVSNYIKWYRYSGKVCYKTKYMFTIQFSNCTLRHVVERNENLRLTKKKTLYINVYGSFIHNNPKLKKAQKSFNK